MAKKKRAKAEPKPAAEKDLDAALTEIITGDAANRPKRRGRPPLYETEDEFSAMVWEYIDHCKEAHEMPNKAGMRFFLRISHDTWNVYRTKFPDAHKEAEDYIENQWIQRLAGTTPTGAIFYLKNAFHQDYKDRHENENTNTHHFSLSKDDIGALFAKLPQEQQDALYAILTTALTGGTIPGGSAKVPGDSSR